MITSESFLVFLQQLNARGADKADGFDRRAFDGLTPDERPRVEQMLLAAVERGDNTAAEGLLLFDRARASSLLAGALGRIAFENGAGASVAGQLWLLTRDPQYERELARYLRHPSAPTRLTALGYLKQASPDVAVLPAWAATVEEDSSRVNRSIAASLLLYCLGRVPSADAAYRVERPLMKELTSENVGARHAAIARVMQPASPR